MEFSRFQSIMRCVSQPSTDQLEGKQNNPLTCLTAVGLLTALTSDDKHPELINLVQPEKLRPTAGTIY